MKITSNNEDMLRSACEQFADKKVGDIQDIARFFSSLVVMFIVWLVGYFLYVFVDVDISPETWVLFPNLIFPLGSERPWRVTREL